MINLNDLINILWIDGDKPISVNTSDGTPYDYDTEVFPNDPKDLRFKTVESITVYDSCVVIHLEE